MSWDKLENIGDVKIYENTSYDKIIKRAINAKIVIINKCNFDKHILSALPNLKYICESATGYDNIDLIEARKRGIIVSNVKGYSTTSVVQQVFALIFALTNKSEYYSTQVHSERWTNHDFFTFWDFPIHEISGKTLGLYGFGKIASKVAKIASAFGMNIIANRKNQDKGYGDNVSHVSLNKLFTKSDILSLHAPQTSENTNLINKTTLSMMKSNAILINTARGNMINEKDLRDALDNHIIAGAGLDVLSTEPPRKDNPIIGAKNCIITPHQAWTSIEARQKLMNGVIENINGFIEGKLINVVN
jgi:glycerate dehydrogenase